MKKVLILLKNYKFKYIFTQIKLFDSEFYAGYTTQSTIF